MNNLIDREEYFAMNESNNVYRNSIMFKKFVEDKGFTLLTVKKLLNKYGITKYDKYISDSGEWIEQDENEYLGSRDYHSSDNGLRTHAEKELDCTVGDIQGELFCIKSGGLFSMNDEATKSNTSDSNITKKSDFIYNPLNMKVEFKTSPRTSYFYRNGKIINNINLKNIIYYQHRDGKFEDSLNKGEIYLLYFYNENKLILITKECLNKTVFISGTSRKYGKLWTDVVISIDKSDNVIDFDLFSIGKSKNEIEKLMDNLKERN